MSLKRISEHMIDKNFVKKVDDHTDKINTVNEQLAEIAPVFLDTGIEFDGTTDMTNVFQNLINNAKANKTKKLLFPKSSYKITSPIIIDGDDLEIDLNGSTILWYGTNQVQTELRDVAVFNIKGSVVSTQTITSLQPDYRAYDGNNLGGTTRACRIKTDNNSLFAIGDYVRIEYFTGQAPYSTSTLLPNIDITTKIVDITSDGWIVVDYYSPYNFSNLTPVIAKLHKLKTVNNVKIKNFTIDDKIVPAIADADRGIGAYPDPVERATFVSGVSTFYTVNTVVENVVGKNTKFPLSINFYSYNNKYKDLFCDNPGIYGSGEGYTLQIMGCLYNDSEKIGGFATRHIIDYARSAFCRAYRCLSPYTRQLPFTMHGECEHDLVWEDCHGKFNCGHGIANFTCITQNVNFYRCSGEIQIDVDSSYVKDIKFYDCEMILRNFHPLTATFTNCKTSKPYSGASWEDLYPNKRGTTYESFLRFIGGSLDFTNVNAHATDPKISLKNYDKVQFEGVSINSDGTTSMLRLAIEEIRRFMITDSSTLRNIIFSNYATSKTIYYVIKDNIITYDIDPGGVYLFSPRTFTSSTCMLDISDNQIFTSRSDGKVVNVLHTDTFGSFNFSSSAFIIKVKNNQMYATRLSNININLNVSDATYKVINDVSGNMIYNAGSGFDATKNTIFTL